MTDRCLHERSAPRVEARCDYGLLAYLFLAMGSTVRPKRVRFVCLECHETFDIAEDPETLAKYA